MDAKGRQNQDSQVLVSRYVLHQMISVISVQVIELVRGGKRETSEKSVEHMLGDELKELDLSLHKLSAYRFEFD